jgi:calcineurin-like phosphoesterase family protein
MYSGVACGIMVNGELYKGKQGCAGELFLNSPDKMSTHLGDFSFGDERSTDNVLRRLNGNKTLIYGNHDRLIRKSSTLRGWFNECVDYKELDIKDDSFTNGSIKIVMSHFPFLQWNKSHYGSLHLHGHCHGNMRYPWPAKILDVGTDVHNYTPISYEEILKIMKSKPIPKIDHH